MIIIDTSKKFDLSLIPETEKDAKAQEIYILVRTIQGECPMYRNFGISNAYLHMPITAAQTAFTLAVTEAFRQFMPGMRLNNIRFVASDGVNGILNPVLEVIDDE